MKTNIIYCGDCLQVLKDKVPDESVDLIYLDPPFFSNQDYENFWLKDRATKTGFSDKDWKKMKDAIDPTILAECEAIEERWKGGRKGIYVYIAYLKERMIQCERVLKKTGSIYLHCDWHAGHYLKVMMDEIFGYDKFQNEIIWSYRTGGATKKRWSRKHDTIFWYSKGNRWTYNLRKERIYYDKPFFNPQVDKDGRYYADVLPIDVWGIPAVINVSKERMGYPTQKPEALLERIIKASSNKGDVVLDPFAGCGTTMAVCKRLGRKFTGIDISRTGCDVTRERLGGGVPIIGGETIDELKAMDPHDFARWVCVEKLGGTVNRRKSGDMGIDGWCDFKTTCVEVKRWTDSKVGRPVIDGFRTHVVRDGRKKGIVVGFAFSRQAYAEAKRKTKDNIKIKLIKVEDLLEASV